MEATLICSFFLSFSNDVSDDLRSTIVGESPAESLYTESACNERYLKTSILESICFWFKYH